jgi:hypothetical protein
VRPSIIALTRRTVSATRCRMWASALASTYVEAGDAVKTRYSTALAWPLSHAARCAMTSAAWQDETACAMPGSSKDAR